MYYAITPQHTVCTEEHYTRTHARTHIRTHAYQRVSPTQSVTISHLYNVPSEPLWYTYRGSPPSVQVAPNKRQQAIICGNPPHNYSSTVCTYVCMHVCTYVCMYVHMYVCMYSIYIRMCVCTMYVCTYVWMHICTYNVGMSWVNYYETNLLLLISCQKPNCPISARLVWYQRYYHVTYVATQKSSKLLPTPLMCVWHSSVCTSVLY